MKLNRSQLEEIKRWYGDAEMNEKTIRYVGALIDHARETVEIPQFYKLESGADNDFCPSRGTIAYELYVRLLEKRIPRDFTALKSTEAGAVELADRLLAELAKPKS
jgi:hypothetical protein